MKREVMSSTFHIRVENQDGITYIIAYLVPKLKFCFVLFFEKPFTDFNWICFFKIAIYYCKMKILDSF